jgi:glycosyltransferase involved in cell wall biosynthesis
MSRIATARAHIAHILSSFAMGGQERVALDLAAGQVRAGYRVTAVSLAPPPDGPLASQFRAARVEVERVARPRPGLDPWLVLRLARLLKEKGVDLTHTHNRMALIYGAPAARLSGAAVVHTKHGRNPRGGTRLLAGNVAARCLDAFVAVSPELAEFARRRKEVDDGRLSVILNGVDVTRFRPDAPSRERVRAELGIEREAWVVGTVGRLAVEKNQALLLRAAAPLLGPASRLVVAGDGPRLRPLSELATSLGIGPFVHILGARSDVPAVLNALDVFVLCSDTEGLPLVILEAMATGLPVVSTSVGGIPGVIEVGRTGYLVAAGDEGSLRDRITMLRGDREKSRTCGREALSVAAARFSADAMRRDYVDLYECILSRRARRRWRTAATP